VGVVSSKRYIPEQNEHGNASPTHSSHLMPDAFKTSQCFARLFRGVSSRVPEQMTHDVLPFLKFWALGSSVDTMVEGFTGFLPNCSGYPKIK
jgi:hypothetical protein